jgi:hypothetical protein
MDARCGCEGWMTGEERANQRLVTVKLEVEVRMPLEAPVSPGDDH